MHIISDVYTAAGSVALAVQEVDVMVRYCTGSVPALLQRAVPVFSSIMIPEICYHTTVMRLKVANCNW